MPTAKWLAVSSNDADKTVGMRRPHVGMWGLGSARASRRVTILVRVAKLV